MTSESELEAALHRQEQIVDEVRKLRITSRRLGELVAIGFIILAAVAVLAVIALHASRDARDAQAHIELIVADNKAAAEQTALQACLLRNNTPRAYREGTNLDIDATADLLQRAGTPQADIDRYVAARRKAIPPIEVTDRDCNGDGRITPDDYPAD